MKQRELLARLRRMAKDANVDFELQRHGGNHDQYRLGALPVHVPRHREVSERLAESVLDAARSYLEQS